MKKRLIALEQTLHKEVPLTRQMGMRVEAHDGRELVVQADFEPNINIHGTAFGGSLFSLCAVTCWGLLHMKFEEVKLAAHSVLGEASISFSRPVRGDIQARCLLPDDGSFEQFMEKSARREKTWLELIAEIYSGDRPAVRFNGRYSAYFH